MSDPEQAFAEVARGAANETAWEAIYSTLKPRLVAYVTSLLITFRIPAIDLAPDVVHDAFLSVVPSWQRGDIRLDSFTGLERYLKRTCRNALLDHYRHHQSAARLIDFIGLTFIGAFETETGLHRAMFVEQIVRQLPPECGRILLRYVQNDLTLAELADEEGLSPATFYTRWYRCLQKARDAGAGNVAGA